MSSVVLHANSITLSYGDAAVFHDFSFQLEAGSFVGLVGANGAGKTTLLKGLSGQFKPQSGQIIFQDFDVYQNDLEYKRHIGYVHDEPFFYPYLSATEFLRFIAAVKGKSKLETAKQVASNLAMVSLLDEQHKLTSVLSHGMKMKLAIAAALIGQPQILFLDEALNGIDVESAYRIKAALQEYARGGGTILLSTHVLEVIEKICTRYVVLQAGMIVADLSSDDFKADGKDLEKYVVEVLRG